MGGLACKAKVRLNGLMVQTIVHGVCYEIDNPDYVSVETAELEMIGYLNEMEDLAFKLQRAYLESQGYNGPWPHALTP